jgi:hypothetical protein
MYTLSAFQRRLHAGHRTRDVLMEAGQVHWLPAQIHAGENTGATPTHVLFVELKAAGAASPAPRGGAGQAHGSPPPRPVIGPS